MSVTKRHNKSAEKNPVRVSKNKEGRIKAMKGQNVGWGRGERGIARDKS
jgi:hypothetical protein